MTRAATSRTTRQRSAIRGVLQEPSPFRTAQEVHALLTERGVPVGLTTVYRTLQTFEAEGEVDVVANDQGEAMYRWCEVEDHHHHIVCRSCGIAAELRSRAIERWVEQSAAAHGFSEVTHTAEMFGLCRNCS
ncbi:MAG: transcriptional repressor [Actinomycetota bacterium]|nr:transcriptional repressor [Actinomycetota bacterium]